MKSAALRWLEGCMGASIRGKPRYMAERVAAWYCRLKWVALAAIVFMIIDPLLFVMPRHREHFLWGWPWMILLVHGAAVAVIVYAIAPRGRPLTIRQAQRLCLIGTLGPMLAAAVTLGLSRGDPSLVPLVSLTMVVALLILPNPISHLITIFLATMVIVLAVGYSVVPPPGHDARTGWPYSMNNLLAAGALGITMNLWQFRSFRLRWKSEQMVVRSHRQIAWQKREIERLLSSTLPAPVAEELRKTGRFEPLMDEVCVIAVDIANFSTKCNRMSQKDVVEALSRFYAEFDDCCQKWAIEPLRSQGDSRIAIGGLWLQKSEQRRRPAIDAILAMLDFQKRLRSQPTDASGATGLWPARIGIHVGPVVMGVLNGVRLSFDCWGETVNIAARLQQGARLNAILVSDRVLCGARGLFEHVPVDAIKVKDTLLANISEITGLRPQYQDESGEPNHAFWAVYHREGYCLTLDSPEPAPADAESAAEAAAQRNSSTTEILSK